MLWRIPALLLLAVDAQARPSQHSHLGEYIVSPETALDLETHHLYAAAAMCKNGNTAVNVLQYELAS
jgi:hypothetical protein